MSAAGPAKEIVVGELQHAVERRHDDIARVEFWADARGGFAKPIPDYNVAGSRSNDFILPDRGRDSGRMHARGGPDECARRGMPWRLARGIRRAPIRVHF